MKKLIIPLIFLFASCKQQKEYGSISGNIFYKYNNFVGNRGDAGANIEVYKFGDTILHRFVSADVRGDFTIDSLETGRYIVVIHSSRNTEGPESLISNLKTALDLTQEKDTALLHRVSNAEAIIKLLSNKASEALSVNEGMKGVRIYENLNDSIKTIFMKAINNIPNRVFLLTGIRSLPYARAFDISLVDITPNSNKKIVVDFGITYL